MAEAGRVQASITVIGEDLEPEEITRILGATPDRSHRTGDQISHKGPWRRKQGLWCIGSIDGGVSESAPVSEHIEALMQRTTSDPSAWRGVAERYEIRVFVGWFMAAENEGITLPPTLLEELGRRSLRLQFDVYGSDGEEGSPPA